MGGVVGIWLWHNFIYEREIREAARANRMSDI